MGNNTTRMAGTDWSSTTSARLYHPYMHAGRTGCLFILMQSVDDSMSDYVQLEQFVEEHRTKTRTHQKNSLNALDSMMMLLRPCHSFDENTTKTLHDI